MYQISLFLGLPIDEYLNDFLNRLDPSVAEMFIAPEGDYLSIAEHKGLRYLGKSAGEMAMLEDLDLLQANVFSLLARLFPDYPLTQAELELFPVAV